MKNSLGIKRLVGFAILTALVVVFQFMSNYITIGTVNITLALIPIAVGAILYGPLAGLFLGIVMGAIVLASPSTQAYFMSVNPWATVILCLLKTGLAGFAAGWVYKGVAHFAWKREGGKRKGIIVAACIAATVIVPVVNTGLFIVGASAFFNSVYGAESFSAAFPIIVAAVFGPNFAIEATVSIVLSPAVVTVLKVITRNNDLGYKNDFSPLAEEDEEPDMDTASEEAVVDTEDAVVKAE